VFRPASHLDRDQAVAALTGVLDSGLLCGIDGGPQVHRFERAFADHVGMPHAIGVSSGSAALLSALRALELEPGDEVILPAFTFIADLLAVLHANARPVFAEIEGGSYCIDPGDVVRRITERTKAIVVVHLFGRPAAVDRIVESASRAGVAVVEDCCQAHGATLGGRKVGSFGDVACFSFAQGHIMSAGGGGIALARDAKVAERLRCLRFYGVAGVEKIENDEERDHDRLGFNFAMTEFSAALARLQLEKLEEIVASRREVADTYARELADIPELELPDGSRGVDRPTYHLYPIRLGARARISRAELAAELQRRGVGFLVTYPRGLHQMSVLRTYPYRGPVEALPVAEDRARRTLGLFCGGGVTPAVATEWSAAIADAVGS
jgi:perosamine synthetase